MASWETMSQNYPIKLLPENIWDNEHLLSKAAARELVCDYYSIYCVQYSSKPCNFRIYSVLCPMQCLCAGVAEYLYMCTCTYGPCTHIHPGGFQSWTLKDWLTPGSAVHFQFGLTFLRLRWPAGLAETVRIADVLILGRGRQLDVPLLMWS